MSELHEAEHAPSVTDATTIQPRPSALFDGEVPIVHSVSRFGRQTTRIPHLQHLSTSVDQTTHQPSAPEQSPVMVYSRVSVESSAVHDIGSRQALTGNARLNETLRRSSLPPQLACRILRPCFRLRGLTQISWPQFR